mmetsp:Transcript_19298/g.21549  ORF Transcript_19298/g.21549 Transcript_19298/m.21549 type:complete len:394 (+) Transcript_19298:203-1384(+)
MMQSNDVECPICLNGMNDADLAYPLLCPAGCGYNFCLKCVESLVVSSGDDYQMASDGNRHVKISLTCPQCRGDLQHTIKDTLTLRKAKNCERFDDILDSELTATELKQKHEYMKLYANEVKHAELRLRKFHRDNGESYKVPEPLQIQQKLVQATSPKKSSFIDSTIFQGIEIAMSTEEQEYVQDLMTMGQSENLAHAAQILDGILQLTMLGMVPKNLKERSRNEERRHIEIMDVFKKQCPLPARLPKYYMLSSFPSRKSCIQFEDDLWDGSIVDAFSRMSVTNKRNLQGIQNIMKGANVSKFQPKLRVRITSVKGQAGKVGLQKGDIITHLNGEIFQGSANDIQEYISRLYESDNGSSKFQIVVNADDATAKALKLRSERCEMIMQEAKRNIQ